MDNNLRGNILEVRKKMNEVLDMNTVLDKKLESISMTMQQFAQKTNVGIYRDLSGQIEGYRALVKDLNNTINSTVEASEIEHKKQVNIVSGLNY